MIWLPDFSKDSTVCERYKGRGLGGGKDHSGRVEPPGASAAEMKLFLILLLGEFGGRGGARSRLPFLSLSLFRLLAFKLCR